MSGHSLTQPDRQDELVSPTSSVEELSFINQNVNISDKRELHSRIRPEPQLPTATVQPYKHPVSSSHSLSLPHPLEFSTQAHQQQPPFNSTYLSHPTHPSVNLTTHPHFSKVPYQMNQHEIRDQYSSMMMMKGSGNIQQPLGIATANLALAHNAAATGDTVLLVSLNHVSIVTIMFNLCSK